MTKEEFIERIAWNEPTLLIDGVFYTICHPKEIYYFYESDSTDEKDQAYNSAEEMLKNADIHGKKLIDFLPEINF